MQASPERGPLVLDRASTAVWGFQAIIVILLGITVFGVFLLNPAATEPPSFLVGVLVVTLASVMCFVVPWSLLPRSVEVVIPLLDVVAIAAFRWDNTIGFGLLWIFPIYWVATRMRGWWNAAIIGAIVVIIVVNETASHTIESTSQRLLSLVLLPFVLASAAVLLHRVSRRSQGLRALLTSQTNRLLESLERTQRVDQLQGDILNAVGFGVAIVTDRDRVAFANEAFRRLYGTRLTASGIATSTLEYRAIGSTPVPFDEHTMIRAVRREEFAGSLAWVVAADTSWRAIQSTSVLLRETDHGEASTLVVIEDRTEIVNAERERDDVTAMVTHELKHPLSAIVGFADLALESPDLPDSVRQYLEIIQQNGDRMTALVAEILAQRGGAPQARPVFGDVDLAQVVRTSVDAFTPKASAARVALSTEVASVSVRGDATRLRQIVDNLISNAIKYSTSGDRVEVRVRREEGHAVITVADHGIGIAKDELDRISQRYFRAENARSSRVPGAGLGLAIVRQFVAEHAGTIEVESELGRGTTVTVTVPVRDDPVRDDGVQIDRGGADG